MGQNRQKCASRFVCLSRCPFLLFSPFVPSAATENGHLCIANAASHNQNTINHYMIPPGVGRQTVRIAISRKQHFRSPKRKNKNTLQYKLPPKTWENSPQKPLLASRKWFFGHCYVQNVRFLENPSLPDFLIFCGDQCQLRSIFFSVLPPSRAVLNVSFDTVQLQNI